MVTGCCLLMIEKGDYGSIKSGRQAIYVIESEQLALIITTEYGLNLPTALAERKDSSPSGETTTTNARQEKALYAFSALSEKKESKRRESPEAPKKRQSSIMTSVI